MSQGQVLLLLMPMICAQRKWRSGGQRSIKSHTWHICTRTQQRGCDVLALTQGVAPVRWWLYAMVSETSCSACRRVWEVYS